MGMPQRYIYQDSRKNQLAEVGLDPAGIARTVRAAAAKTAAPAEVDIDAAV